MKNHVWRRKEPPSPRYVRAWWLWIEAVLTRVRFRPDHDAIRKELTAHLEDNCLDLERLGYEKPLAEQRALEAMGSAEQVGRGLDKAHSPFLGWIWRLSKWLVIGCTIFALWLLFFDGVFEAMADRTLGQLLTEVHPSDAVQVDLEDYTIWYRPVLSLEKIENEVNVSMDIWIEAKTPWTGEPMWLNPGLLRVEDDQGAVSRVGFMQDYGCTTWTRYHYTCVCYLDHTPAWLELRYPHGNNDWVLRAEGEASWVI